MEQLPSGRNSWVLELMMEADGRGENEEQRKRHPRKGLGKELCHHLCELGTMPQCGPAFADAVTKLLRALHFWCAEVDEAIRTVEQDELGAEATRDFDSLLEPGVGALTTA